ncbi:hypothetical protein PBCVNY2B_891L [Paramecium bursaria Chlorella virus NY2B]|uniref:Uncharacterized protein n=1 Tax=Paramecium bursaria Chlorella virus NYs1 TaxID=83442 RepID=M1IK82_9PHYC|nr:hypothetical protein AR158_c775R [Paramecium bursaria Chlorella virus AR158]YP_009665575.1 hypothetical protein FK949_gp195 [Paramecium bursaria Chlorella virus NYs1]AGE54433.1 hypothetical protein PBCVIL52s1_904L [Paramecium bursaria Chlorella virus IL-5-2s1]AGE55113.1 hypothetical protein PBCVMA1D_880L [Paramecium bursaria Chlorella virus MA1D]AGE58553.1 hypothetical protein PBCVNY2B_891L [Paramecium bursaria Chlorella virus NY2B]ABU44320.1 hypothetical protein AR158_c775R [Paramecium bur
MPRKCKCERQCQPYFGFPGDKIPTWCSKCPDKPGNAINIVSKKCKCGKSQPYFGLPGQKAQWCSGCKSDEAIDVKNKKCKCGKSQPYFGIPGEKAQWCSGCKPDDAIDVVNKKCKCGNGYPIYGLPDEKALWCSKCKSNDAINVVSKKCPCENGYPIYGIPGDKTPTWCKNCKPGDAINVASKKCPCGKQSKFGLPGQKAEWCSECKPDNAIDVVNPICSGYDGVPCPVRTHLANGKQYCLSCDPDEYRRLSRKKDEHAFFCFLEKHDIEVTQREYRIDYRCIDTNKSHAFIDGVIITPDIVMCLEVDENAHRHYESGCDKARMHLASTELLLAFPEHHIAWVRVNPTIGDFDRSDKALKVRDERYFEAVLLIRDLIQNPRTDVMYVGYS